MRRPTRLAIAVTLAAAPVVGVAAPAALTSSATAANRAGVLSVHLNGFESSLTADINKARRSAGLRPLVVIPGATDVARRWSWRMAHSQVLSHNPSIVHDITSAGSAAWTEIAENVGEGPSDSPHALFGAYMASPPHRANILDPAARYVGMGTVERDGIAWNTIDFTNAYNNRYGRTRVPADGLTMDRNRIISTTNVAMLEKSSDQRFAARHHGGLTASRLSFTGPTSRNDAAYTWVRQTGGSSGRGGMMMREALDLSRATTLRLQLSARGTRSGSVPVRVYLERSFGGTVSLGTVHVGSNARWVDLALPSAARSFRNALVLKMTANAVRSAGGRVRLAMYDVQAHV